MEPKQIPDTSAPENTPTNPASGTPPAEQPLGNFESVVITPTTPTNAAGIADTPAAAAATPPAELSPDTVTPAASVSPKMPATIPAADATVSAAETPTSSEPSVTVASSGGDFGEPTKKKWNKKKLFIVGGSSLLLALLAGGFVFGYYLPNTPSQVWSTSLNRTGKALDTVVASATEAKKLEAYKTSIITGGVDATFDGQKYNGTFTTTFDQANSNSGVVISSEDAAGKKSSLNIQALTNIATGSNYPNIYLQVTGLKSLGLDTFVPGVSAYDGKWIAIDATYLESLGDSYLSTTDNNEKQITSADIAEVARVTSNVTSDYLLTTDKDKAVFVKQSFVGKETVDDGVSAYHYKVGLNIEHAKAYCTALSDALISTTAYKKLANPKDDDLKKAKTDAAEECKKTVPETFKASDSFDLWVDSQYKLVYKIRVYDKTDKGTYTDVGQRYKGDDQLSLFVKWHDTKAKSDASFTLETNLKTSTTSGLLSAKSTDADSPYDVKVTIQAKTSAKEVEFTKPTPTIPVQDVMKTLGMDSPATTSSPSSSSVQSKSEDAQRKTDINALTSHLEAQYAKEGFYPTAANLNLASWRKANMPGLDPEALKDPSGTSSTVVTTATATQYGYAPTGCNSQGCEAFTVTAKLSDGTIYTKSSNQ